MSTVSTLNSLSVRGSVFSTLACAYPLTVRFHTGAWDDLVLTASQVTPDFAIELARTPLQEFAALTGFMPDLAEFSAPSDYILFFAQTTPWHVARLYRCLESKQFEEFSWVLRSPGRHTLAYGNAQKCVRAMLDLFAVELMGGSRSLESPGRNNPLLRRSLALKKFVTWDFRK